MSDLQKFLSNCSTGKISRRRLLQQAAALGGLATLQGLGIPQLEGTALAATKSGKRGGHARFGIGSGSSTDSLDPATINSTFMQLVNWALRNNLTEIAPDGKLVPELSESWEHSKDARVWRFKLRRDVEFHNGKTFDVHDAIASLQHNYGKKSTSSAKAILGVIDSLKADGKYTLIVTLKQPDVDFPYYLSTYQLTMLPATKDGVDATSGNGTGGYVLEQFEPGVRASMKRFPNYWKKDAAYFDSADVLAQRDSTSRIDALVSGQVDVINRVPLNLAPEVKKRPGMNVVAVDGGQQVTFRMRVDRHPFNDNNVRLALKYAIDRKAFLERILSGYGALANDTPIAPRYPYFDKNLPQRHYDPDRAKHHLKKAGMDKLTVNLKVSNAPFQDAVDGSVLYQSSARKAGITIRVDKVPSDGYWSSTWEKSPFCVGYWGGRSTVDWMFTVGYAPHAPWNVTRWRNPTFDKLLKEARGETDSAKRAQMYAEMQRLMRNRGGVVIPVFLDYVMGLRDNIHHNKIAANWGMDGLRAIERWWMA